MLVKAKFPGPRPLQLEEVDRKRRPGHLVRKRPLSCTNSARRFALYPRVSPGDLYPICTRQSVKIKTHAERPRPTFTPRRVAALALLPIVAFALTALLIHAGPDRWTLGTDWQPAPTITVQTGGGAR